MPSNTQNVKLGVCQVFFNGVDLGYTQGGVEVSVATETHKVNVDQFGKTSINEYIMGREATVKVPLAETTLDNLVATMPGATLLTDGVAASGTMTVATQPTAGQTVVVGGTTFTFRTGTAPLATDVLIGANQAATAVNLAAAITASGLPVSAKVNSGAIATITHGVRGTVGNAFTIATGTAAAAVTVSAATLTGGVNSTYARVEVTSGVGLDLLSTAKELRLHPQGKAVSDKSEDFVLPLANTPGNLTFAYKLEEERIFQCDFTGYPDPVTGKLFVVGQ
jgi:hypothetical protein